MPANPDQLEGFGPQESGAIAAEAARGRTLDRPLTDELEHRAPSTRAVSSRYTQELGHHGRARRLGVSAERVRQLENRALGKLRAAATGDPDAG